MGMTELANNLGGAGGGALQIGGLHLDGRAFLAPMAGVTDLGMRRLARRFGASLTVSEMVAAGHYARGDAANRLKAEGAGAGKREGAERALVIDRLCSMFGIVACRSLC